MTVVMIGGTPPRRWLDYNVKGLWPDWKIRQMVQDFDMIDPFVDGQVAGGAISYGLSSFGYDIRVADEYRIFTPATGQLTVIDPKAIDERAMVSYQGPYCIIPPNSFALARTVEYFRIPRNALTICLGKSTYARCFAGDTRVATTNRKQSVTLEQMAERSARGERFWGYGVDGDGLIVITELVAPRYIGRDSLLEIVLDNGDVVKCTPDHQFMLRDGRMLEAQYLQPGSSLMPLYRRAPRGYEGVYQPLLGRLHPTHRSADDWNVRHGVYADAPGMHRHHVDGNRRNNNPDNIIQMGASEHIRMHNEANFGDGFDPRAHGSKVSAAIAARALDPDWSQRFSEIQRRKATQFWTEAEYADVRANLIAARQNMSDETRKRMSESHIAWYSNPAARAVLSEAQKAGWADDEERRKRQAEVIRNLNRRADITADAVLQALREAGNKRGAARLLNCDRSVFRRFPDQLAAFTAEATAQNHKVVSIRALPGEHDVYCLTAPDTGNFALQAGVFVKNCGIIVNVTPFEPEWEGFVTIEISNTTPLPCKIYSNEGIAQVLFLAGEEPETSYADRKGKYQKQAGIVLPRI